jgi:hypothetical protein
VATSLGVDTFAVGSAKPAASPALPRVASPSLASPATSLAGALGTHVPVARTAPPEEPPPAAPPPAVPASLRSRSAAAVAGLALLGVIALVALRPGKKPDDPLERVNAAQAEMSVAVAALSLAHDALQLPAPAAPSASAPAAVGAPVASASAAPAASSSAPVVRSTKFAATSAPMAPKPASPKHTPKASSGDFSVGGQ